MNTRVINIFFKISNAQQCRFMGFVRVANMKLFCKSANQNKNNLRFTTLTKPVNNQTNCRSAFENMYEENMDLSHIYLAGRKAKSLLSKYMYICTVIGVQK